MVKAYDELPLSTTEHMLDPFTALFQQRQDPSPLVTNIFQGSKRL